MVEVKKNKLSKTHLAIIITSAVLVFLIAGYVVLSAVIASISGKNNEQTQQKEPIALKDGEALNGSNPVAYAPIPTSAIVCIGVTGDKSEYIISRPKEATTEENVEVYANYFLFSYRDEYDKEQIYYPDIMFAENGVNYNEFYATDDSLGVKIPKITRALSAIGSMYFVDRLEPEADFDAQLARYGLDTGHRDHIYVKYLTTEGEKELDIYVGNKLISGKGYYYMIGGRNYIYVSSSTQFDNLLCDVENFLHSRVVAAGLPGDKLYGPFLTEDYKQWTNTFYGSNSKEGVSRDSEVIVSVDIVNPIYDSTSEEGGDGYERTGYSTMHFNLKELSKSEGMSRIIEALVDKQVKRYENADEIVASRIINSNEAELGKNYKYTITKIEAVVTDKGDDERTGREIDENDLVRVTYKCEVEGKSISTEPLHAIMDLSSKNIDPDAKGEIVKCKVGDEVKIEWTEEYDEQNATLTNVKIFITKIIHIQARDSDGNLVFVDKITPDCIVKFAYKYVINGKEVGEEMEKLVDLGAVTKEEDLVIKDKIQGLRPGDKLDDPIYDESKYVQYMQNFQTYRFCEIIGFIEREMVVSFRFLNPSVGEGRDPFYAESIYENTLNSYPLDAVACQNVTFLLGGIGSQSSNTASGLVGNKTVAVGLTPANMVTYGLYDGYTIYFKLPRGISIMGGSGSDELDNFTSAGSLGFTLYISRMQSNGTRYIASDLYDIIVEVDGEQFNFLEKSFGEYWARKDLVMVDYLNLDSIEVDINMDDIYGSYAFLLDHSKKSYKDGVEVAPGTEGANVVNHLKVTAQTRSLTESISDSVFANFIKNNPVLNGKVDISDLYDMVAGEKLMVRKDRAGASSFKNILQMLYAVNYTGSLDADEAEDVIENCEKILSMKFSLVGELNDYVYDFYRASDRKVMVHIYRVDHKGDVINSDKDDSVGFYISTFAAKKIVNAFNDLLNGVMVNPDVSYWS